MLNYKSKKFDFDIYLNLRKEEKIMTGADVKKLLRDKQICQWRLAQELNVGESTLVRWLRGSLSVEHEKSILKAMERLIANEE